MLPARDPSGNDLGVPRERMRPPPKEDVPNFCRARLAFSMFVVGNVVTMLLLRPLVRDGICFWLWGAPVVPALFFPVIGLTLFAWFLMVFFLRHLLRKYRGCFAPAPGAFVPSNNERRLMTERLSLPIDRVLRWLRRLAIWIVVLEVIWLVVSAGIVFVALDDYGAYGQKICFPERFQRPPATEERLPPLPRFVR